MLGSKAIVVMFSKVTSVTKENYFERGGEIQTIKAQNCILNGLGKESLLEYVNKHIKICAFINILPSIDDGMLMCDSNYSMKNCLINLPLRFNQWKGYQNGQANKKRAYVGASTNK